MWRKSARRRLSERAQLPADVAQGRALAPPFRQLTRGLALEVDDDEVLAGVEHLAEMQVAMRTLTRDRQAMLQERIEARADLVLVIEDRLRPRLQLLGQYTHSAAELAHHAAKQIAHRLVDRALIERRIPFGREVRIVQVRQ